MNSPLKSVPALQVRITCSSTQPTAAQIVALLREKTGVRLALDPKIDPAKPALGSIGGTSAAGTPAAVNSGSAKVRSASSATASPFRSTAPPQPSRVGKSRTWIEPDFLRLRRRPRNLCGAGVFGTMLRGLGVSRDAPYLQLGSIPPKHHTKHAADLRPLHRLAVDAAGARWNP